MAAKVKTAIVPPRIWTCACGRQHVVEPGKKIECAGRGHSVTIMPAYFEKENVKAPQEKDKYNYGLFKM